MKRGCEGLAPVCQEVFESRLADVTKARASKTQRELKCGPCGKTFTTKASYDHHMRSKKHIQRAKNVQERRERKAAAASAAPQPSGVGTPQDAVGSSSGAGMKTGESAEEEKNGIPVTHCVFCHEKMDTLEVYLEHLLRAHSFFLPYIERLISLEAFLEYLGQKVGRGHQCVYCNHLFKDVEAVRQHMRDKGHCKLSLDTEEDVEEYGGFFRPPSDKGLGGSGGEGDADAKSSAAAGRALVIAAPRATLQVSDLGLVLKNGRIVGHRSMARYYRQKLRPGDPVQHSKLVTKMATSYRQIGLPGYRNGSQRNERSKRDVMRMNKAFMKLGFKNNKPKHFRDSTMQGI